MQGNLSLARGLIVDKVKSESMLFVKAGVSMSSMDRGPKGTAETPSDASCGKESCTELSQNFASIDSMSEEILMFASVVEACTSELFKAANSSSKKVVHGSSRPKKPRSVSSSATALRVAPEVEEPFKAEEMSSCPSSPKSSPLSLLDDTGTRGDEMEVTGCSGALVDTGRASKLDEPNSLLSKSNSNSKSSSRPDPNW